jgi:hypothetical protein
MDNEYALHHPQPLTDRARHGALYSNGHPSKDTDQNNKVDWLHLLSFVLRLGDDT